jgi:hypothetical protein
MQRAQPAPIRNALRYALLLRHLPKIKGRAPPGHAARVLASLRAAVWVSAPRGSGGRRLLN